MKVFRAVNLALVAGAALASHAYAKSDEAFMKDAAQAGHAEVEASKVAQSKAKLAAVKAFADTMVADHTKVGDELRQLAGAKKVQLPDGPSMMQASKLKMINAGDDAKFDERYVKTFGVAAHEDAVKLFETAAREAKDPDVKAFAEKTLPGLKHHLEMAKALPLK